MSRLLMFFWSISTISSLCAFLGRWCEWLPTCVHRWSVCNGEGSRGCSWGKRSGIIHHEAMRIYGEPKQKSGKQCLKEHHRLIFRQWGKEKPAAASKCTWCLDKVLLADMSLQPKTVLRKASLNQNHSYYFCALRECIRASPITGWGV